MPPCRDARALYSSAAVARADAGISLLFVIILLIALSALAASITGLSPGAMQTKLTGIQETRAHYLALSGLNFWSPGNSGTYSLAGGSFTLSQTGPDAGGYYTVTSLGRASPGLPGEANCILTARRKPGKPINFDDNIDDFKLPEVGKGTNDARSILVFDSDLPDAPPGISEHEWATLWADNVNRYAGGWMRLGGGLSSSHGAIWYGGDYGSCAGGVCEEGACNDGRCVLGKGLRAYFDFTFFGYDDSDDSTRFADGFTFTVATAANDPATAAGGPASGSRGEYLGYAGPGPAGRGIAPPKIALELDTYPNKGHGRTDGVNSRADAGNANHLAVLFWGAADTTYDDNTHGAGSSPVNPEKHSGGYYEKARRASGANWLEDGQPHGLRLEIHRTSAGAAGQYRVRAWLDPDGEGHDDVTVDYAEETPQIDYTVTLAAADHAALSDIRFGWTEGTGGQTQTVAVYDFSLDFRR